MGDHTAIIKIEFTVHGKTYRTDMNVNYFADDDGMDERVREFFRSAWDDAMDRYHAQNAKHEARRREEEERAELRRLREKYPDA